MKEDLKLISKASLKASGANIHFVGSIIQKYRMDIYFLNIYEKEAPVEKMQEIVDLRDQIQQIERDLRIFVFTGII